MPIYEYDCPRCGVFEATQRITENPISRCPTCRSKVKKLISQTSFQLKGTGWYATDYGRKGNGSGGKESRVSREASNGNGSKESDAKKSEANSEAKKESAST
jgi:putative FmdB family regulatory protein